MRPQTRLVVPDIHVPFHDPYLVNEIVLHIATLQPDGIDIIGDVLDCYTLSRFDKNPLRKGNIQKEVDAARSILSRIRAAAHDGCDIRYNEGNHENRLKRVLWGRAKELAPLRNLTIPKLLDLDSLGIKYYKPENPYKIGRLWYLHGDLGRKCNWSMSFGGTLAAAVCKRIGGSVIMGHSHQMGHVSFRTWEEQLEGHEVGCLCHYNLEYIVGYPQWQQGWAVVDFTASGLFSVSFVRAISPANGKRRHLLFQSEELGTIPPAKVHRMETS